MIRFLWILTVIVLMAPALAQNADPDVDTGDNVEDVEPESEPEPEQVPEDEPVDFDETGLDEQGFSDDDDDFDPTEVIPTDQSIDFPADI